MYLQKEKNSGFHLVHCFPKSLIKSRKYHHFTNRTANHCCQSLNYSKIILYQFLLLNKIEI